MAAALRVYSSSRFDAPTLRAYAGGRYTGSSRKLIFVGMALRSFW